VPSSKAWQIVYQLRAAVMRDVAGRKTPVRPWIEKVLCPQIRVALVIASTVAAAGGQPLAKGVMERPGQVMGIAFAHGSLPGHIHRILRIVLVISFAEIGVRANSRQPIHRIE